MKVKIFKLENITIIIAAIILTCVLMVRPIIGVADNGDFGRIMGSTGLTYLTNDDKERYFGYVNREFGLRNYDSLGGGYFSTGIALVEFAKILNKLATYKSSTFDIRFLGMIYSSFLLISLYFMIKGNKSSAFLTSLFLCILLLLVFTDIGYISYFNSLYGEAVSFSFLLLITGVFLYLIKSDRPRIPLLLAFFICAIFLSGAKSQNAPIGIVIAAFSIRLLYLSRRKLWKAVILTSATLLVFTSIISYSVVPERIKICNKYQTVFYGILKDSPTPEKDLAELGINQDLAVLAGTNYFMKSYPLDISDPLFQIEISRKISPVKVIIFYMKHPERFLHKLKNASNYGFKIAEGFGNYEKADNIEYKQAAKFPGAWSRFKLEVLPHSFSFVFSFFSIYFIVLSIQRLRKIDLHKKLYLEFFMLIGIIGLIQFIVPIIGDGDADISKHLFMFNVCFDLMFISSAVWIFHNFSLNIRKAISLLKEVYNNA